MTRPIKLFAYRLGRDLGIDVEVIMNWPLNKIYEYMAFYLTDSDEFKEEYAEEQMTPEERSNQILKMLGGSI